MLTPSDTSAKIASQGKSENQIVFLVAAVQFINVLDFMMVMPLGPDFATALDIPLPQLGLIAGSYTASAAVAGILGSLFLDRFDRRKALFISMLGLASATLLGGLATGMATLMVARVLAGIFGGPATSLSLAIVADAVPATRRGRAMGTVMGASSVASIFGVPAGLELARFGGWRTPFFAIGGLCLLITVGAFTQLPEMKAHLQGLAKKPSYASFKRPEYFLALTMVATTMLAAFMLVPNLSAYLQHNRGFPRDKLGYLYMFGGAAGLAAMKFSGSLIDRLKAFPIALIGGILVATVMYLGYIAEVPWIPMPVIFIAFMATMSFQRVAFGSIQSRVPLQAERARYMSIQSAVQHTASALGAMGSTAFLTEKAGGQLEGIPRIATVSALLMLAVAWILRAVEARVLAREQSEGEALKPRLA